MKILAIDTSGLVSSVAILDNDIIIAQYSINYKMTHSVTLMPMLENIVALLKIELKDMDAIAISAGPGSFTGLKIGASTVKAIAFAFNKPIISVETTLALAGNIYLKDGIICPIMDARRNRVYCAIYEYNDYNLSCILEQEVLKIENLIEKINSLDSSCIFLGDGVPVYKDFIDKECKVNYSYAPMNMNLQNAASVAYMARKKYKLGLFETADNHKPIYIRESSAIKQD